MKEQKPLHKSQKREGWLQKKTFAKNLWNRKMVSYLKPFSEVVKLKILKKEFLLQNIILCKICGAYILVNGNINFYTNLVLHVYNVVQKCNNNSTATATDTTKC